MKQHPLLTRLYDSPLIRHWVFSLRAHGSRSLALMLTARSTWLLISAVEEFEKARKTPIANIRLGDCAGRPWFTRADIASAAKLSQITLSWQTVVEAIYRKDKLDF